MSGQQQPETPPAGAHSAAGGRSCGWSAERCGQSRHTQQARAEGVEHWNTRKPSPGLGGSLPG
eukprot:9188892-Alexandrium_andersonii.AAC.1